MKLPRDLAAAEQRKFIASLRGKYRLKADEPKPFAERMADYKREEIELEKRKLVRPANHLA